MSESATSLILSSYMFLVCFLPFILPPFSLLCISFLFSIFSLLIRPLTRRLGRTPLHSKISRRHEPAHSTVAHNGSGVKLDRT